MRRHTGYGKPRPIHWLRLTIAIFVILCLGYLTYINAVTIPVNNLIWR